MRHKKNVWYTLSRLDKKVWYANREWVHDASGGCQNHVQFDSLKAVNKHLRRFPEGLFNLTKWFWRKGDRWAADYKIFPEEE